MPTSSREDFVNGLLSGGSLVFVALLGYRVAVSDKDKRYLRRAFSYYLSPAVIERMISQDKLPALGGESREVTIMFSDIASFATLSEGLNASQVAHFLNEYLTEMSAIVETSGGYIEKFVADEITAVFGGGHRWTTRITQFTRPRRHC